MEYFYEQEDVNGVRFVWNIWPVTRADAEKNVIPQCCFYQPLRNNNCIPRVYADPLLCSNSECCAVFNPYCVNKMDGRWPWRPKLMATL